MAAISIADAVAVSMAVASCDWHLSTKSLLFPLSEKLLNYLFISLTFTEEQGYSLQGTFEEVKRYFDKDKTSNQTNTSETMYNVLGFINFVFGLFFFLTDILDKFLHLCMRVY